MADIGGSAESVETGAREMVNAPQAAAEAEAERIAKQVEVQAQMERQWGMQHVKQLSRFDGTRCTGRSAYYCVTRLLCVRRVALTFDPKRPL